MTWRSSRDGSTQTHAVANLFLMLGAVPNTGWLEGCGLRLDPRGFVLVGAEALQDDDVSGERWRGRRPHLLETSRPGIFAVGDVRSGSIKRVASAVGEGSVVVSSIHQLIALA